MIHLEPQEKIIATVRKHSFVLFVALLPLALGALLPLFLIGLIPLTHALVPTADFSELSPALFIFFYSGWLLLLWVRGFIIWTDYYLDVWTITDRRIIDVEQQGFFSRDISSIAYDRIQDVTVEIHGIIATHFNFGILRVQSAGEAREFKLLGARDPYEIKEMIGRQREAVVHGYTVREKPDTHLDTSAEHLSQLPKTGEGE